MRKHGKWWFSVLDIIAAINEQDDYQKTRNYWKYLKTKLRKENSQLVSATNQLKLKASEGKSYKTDTFDAEGVTLLAKHINNTKATNRKHPILAVFPTNKQPLFAARHIRVVC